MAMIFLLVLLTAATSDFQVRTEHIAQHFQETYELIKTGGDSRLPSSNDSVKDIASFLHRGMLIHIVVMEHFYGKHQEIHDLESDIENILESNLVLGHWVEYTFLRLFPNKNALPDGNVRFENVLHEKYTPAGQEWVEIDGIKTLKLKEEL